MMEKNIFNDFHECVDTLKNSVYLIARGREINIGDEKKLQWTTLGTGFLAAPNRMITASHVIHDKEKKSTHNDDDKYYLIRRSEISDAHYHMCTLKLDSNLFLFPDNDLAIIYLEDSFYTNGKHVFVKKDNYIKISNNFMPIGKEIGILGYPLCKLEFNDSSLDKPKYGNIILRTDKGVINCIFKTSDIVVNYEFTLAFNPGNSGGPIFDTKSGEVISIVHGFKTIEITKSDKGDRIYTSYSCGFSIASFLDILKEHKILN